MKRLINNIAFGVGLFCLFIGMFMLGIDDLTAYGFKICAIINFVGMVGFFIGITTLCDEAE